jgi:hypothetical protein
MGYETQPWWIRPGRIGESMFCGVQMKMCRGSVVLALAMALIQPQVTGAKCINLEIALEGKIIGVGNDLTIRIEVRSAQKGDPVTDVEQESKIENSYFHATAWFNTTSNVVSAETCNRLPHVVLIRLMSGSKELDRQTLTIESDFRRTKESDYRLKKPINLHVPIMK